MSEGPTRPAEGTDPQPGAPTSDSSAADTTPPDSAAATPGGLRARARAFYERARAGAGRRARILARSKGFWAAVAVLLVLGTLWQRCGVRGCPSVATLASYQPGGASVLLDRNGEKFADLGPVDHAVIKIASLPAYVPAAFVAVEDKRFYRHHGVDWRRVGGAAFANLRARRTVQGSSTITMQLSRNLFPERIRAAERTFKRKLLEVRVARDIEHRFSKAEILELYLNHIYFGAGAYGIEAAARQYFGRSARDLSVEQAAVLAALPKAPGNYDPRRHAERARERRDLVLTLMARQGHLSAAQVERARSTPIRVANARAVRERAPRAAFFVQAVRDLLEDRLGEDLYSRPLRIRTTIDLRAQRAAEEELENQIRRVEAGAYGRFAGPRLAEFRMGSAETEYLQGAVVMLDNASGDVLALVGGRDARHSSFNRAVTAQRQAGSAFKPFVYAAALMRGWSPAALLDDEPYRMVRDGRPWEPQNFDGEFHGPVTLRDALVESRNVPTIRLAGEVGERNVARLARAAGIRAELRETPMIGLGIAEVTPLELTAAYTAFAGEGNAVTPRFVVRVEDAEGKVLWEPPVAQRRVMDAGVAYVMTDLLRDAVNRGTGRPVRWAGYEGLAAGKTGTTNEGADTWFVGYTPRVTAGVWVGFDRPRAIAEHASGGSVAAFAWGRMMTRIAPWAGGQPWQAPQHIVRVALDPATGLALAEGCRPREGEARNELFVEGRAPKEVCPERARRERRASVWDRVVAWAGGVVERITQARETKLARAQRSDEDRATAEAENGEAWSPAGRRQREPDWTGFGEPRWRPPADEQWAEDASRALREAYEQRMYEQEQALEWLQGLAEQLRDNVEGGGDAAGERVRTWLDQAARALDEAAQSARRSQRRNVDPWLEEFGRELDRPRPRTRRQIDAEVRRALRELESVAARVR